MGARSLMGGLVYFLPSRRRCSCSVQNKASLLDNDWSSCFGLTGLKICQTNCLTSNFIIFAVCIYRYVITLGLRSKYDVDGHYCRFAPQILGNPPQYDVTLLCYISQLYCMQTFNFIVCKKILNYGK